MVEFYTEMYKQASITLLALIVMSVLALTIGMERLVSTLRFRRRMRHGRASILAHLRDGKHTMAEAVNVSLPWHPATGLFESLLKDGDQPLSVIRRRQSQIIRQARRRMWVLGSIGSIGPFVGLLGTVLGVMEAFHNMGVQGAGGFQVVSSGISEALITTAAGIFVGVEAVVLFNYLQTVLGDYAAELRETVEEIAENTRESPNGISGP